MFLPIALRASLLVGVVTNAVVLPGAGLLLGAFGQEYAMAAAWTLRLLCLAVFPVSIKDHYVTWCRMYGQIARATPVIAVGNGFELIMAALGAHIGGLTG